MDSKQTSPTPSVEGENHINNDLSIPSSEDTVWKDASANTTPDETKVTASVFDEPEAILPTRSYSKWCPTQQGATLVWRDVCIYATNNRKTNLGNLKRIINNSTGAIQPGTLMALMGSR